MKNGFLKRVAAVVLVIIMSISGVVEPKAATGSMIKLFGIHDLETMFEHTNHRCLWMKAVGSQYRKADPTATIKKKHYARASSVYASIKTSDYIIIKTHGWSDGNGIAFFDKVGTTLERSDLSVSDIQNGVALKRLKLCFVAACNSDKMADALYRKGVRCTLGYPASTADSTVSPSFSALLIKKFNKKFTSGQTVLTSLLDSIREMRAEKGDIGAVAFCAPHGDSNLTF